jgi:hypothetical protein
MFIKYHPPILGRKNQMVYQYRNIMTLMYIIAHTYILRRKRRGINPKVIQADMIDVHLLSNYDMQAVVIW